jgi:hypothetical protein
MRLRQWGARRVRPCQGHDAFEHDDLAEPFRREALLNG